MTNDELLRLRRRSELALARARLAEQTPPRDRLLSADDIEEITGRTAALLDERLREAEAPNSVEIETPKGYRVKGAAWPVVVIVLVVAAAAIAWRLAPPLH